ncbi:MAG: amino acid ABC transporter permease [Alphaproteobacteria bacterium]|jgi:polar amino acid transport system permease protein|nr:amino acid ABC transporter permease [Alphaproteobacteria bacterium]MBT4020579.1 amino acid ABC transporter permease [Alphaproteobacteria bacterium]MBT4965054.1 amino acid ABC transporter permease [Alphaproteobacteria bacterium]MBT5160399.1 amino acid ABC transporter permease [Alphaproteobacteria bacterium]
MGLDFSILPEYSDYFLTGTLWTLALTALSMFFSISGGILFAVLQLNRHAIIRWPTSFIAWLFMGTPLLLQLFLVYFGLVQIGIDLNAFVAGVIALSLHFAVYNSDIIRSAIVAVDSGQVEAARSLGLSNFQALRKIIVPQAVANVTPALGNMMIALLKESALVSVIGVMELTLSAQRAISDSFRPFEFYIAAAAIYYIINLGLEQAVHFAERRTARYR